ncbi:hypothetical protein HXX76_014097 [Chlamydomonas incerta]|uniref:DNA helicase n=1 Tax=Chlamydomonas incerta TaxID=51695 RepID=A0A835SMF7_CHLIN|nr:hypothetical protein HXX76_014097 [Chlamydomonas incerta]|eukprot:KAG2424939.1 hypothetical protein HXX76_014097 [Chlamydomonas incerta]
MSYSEGYCSEEQRLAVEAPDSRMLICGCAGSRKTDTLVKICSRIFKREHVNVMIATLVGSVTSELRERLESALGATFTRKGNHFLHTDARGCSIEIANFDAMIHKQLEVHRDPFLLRYGDCHNEKADLLLNKYVLRGRHNSIWLSNNSVADVFLMDEFQDLQATKVRILTEILKRGSPDLKAVAAGDYVQTIFDHAFGEDGSHPMALWRDDLGAAVYNMSRCFRCPVSHVRLANVLLQEQLRYRAVLPDPSANTSMVAAAGPSAPDTRPMLFVCPPASKNNTGDIVAHQVCTALEILRQMEEPDLCPRDVAVIMTRSNNNPVFRQLAWHLGALYRRWGFTDSVKTFETRGDGYCVPIDWAQAVGKTVLLSIHGDKGKGHKVVFFLGFNEGSVPVKARVFTKRELVDLSLMNVALTRSTKWLLVGFNRDQPSRYLRSAPLAQLAALSWDEDTQATPSERAILQSINRCYTGYYTSHKPDFHNPHYIDSQAVTPLKLLLEVKHDVVSMFEHAKALAPHYSWSANVVEQAYGQRCDFSGVGDDLLPVFGTMGELLVCRELCRRFGSNGLADMFLGVLGGQAVYTHCNRLLNAVQDEGLNAMVARGCTTHEFQGVLARIASTHAPYLRHSPSAQAEMDRLMGNQPCCLLPAALEPYVGHLAAFLGAQTDPDTDGLRDQKGQHDEVTPLTAWCAALFHAAIYERIRMPHLPDLLRAAPADIGGLVQNVNLFCSSTTNTGARTFSAMPSMQLKRALTAVETRADILKDMGITQQQRVMYGISGVSDLETPDTIFEIKCPRSTTPSSTWVIQPLVYRALSNDDRKNRLVVVDLTNGVQYIYPNMATVDNRRIVRKILTQADFRPEHIAALAAQVTA